MPLYTGTRTLPTRYLFIDGGCLREFLKRASEKYFNGDPITLNYRELSTGFTKTFYYDSVPPQKRDESQQDYERRIQSQIDMFDALGQIDGWHIYEGSARLRRKAVEQKQVDIMIAVHMLTHSFNRNMDQATLLTSDLDFKPLIDALVQGGMYVTLWYPPENTNKELVLAADARNPIGIRNAHGWATADFRLSHPIPNASGELEKNIQPDDSVVATWKNRYDSDVELYQGSNGYVLVTAMEGNLDTHMLHVRHNSLSMLEMYVKEVFPYIGWMTTTS